MADIFFEVGFISKTSRDESVVTFAMDGSSKSFIFNKRIFFTFGVQCDGDMTNILEEGTEVEVCYKIPHPGKSACILAVWLGEKPESFKEESAIPNAIYGMNGRVSSLTDDSFLVQCGNKTVYIHRSVVYRDGSPLLDNGSLAEDEVLTFDAERKNSLEAPYQATCAWVGSKPKMVDRFDLRSSGNDTGFTGNYDVEGIVAVVPNDVVAIVDVTSCVDESVAMKVLLFRSSFKRRRARMGDIVDVGDRVFIRLGYKWAFPGRRWWYAAQAFKGSDEIIAGGDTDLWEEVTAETERIAAADGTASGVSDEGTLKTSFRMTAGKSGTKFDENGSSKELPTCAVGPVRKKCLSQGVGFLMNCSGTLRVKEGAEPYIDCIFGPVSFIKGTAPYYYTKESTKHLSVFFGCKNFSGLDKLKVRFNAKFIMSPPINWGFYAVSLWRESHLSPDPWYWLESALCCSYDRDLRSGIGVISSIPLHDTAIAVVDGLPVAITLESLVSLEEINLKTSSIDTYLRVGDEIFANIEKRCVEKTSYFRAVKCYVKVGQLGLEPAGIRSPPPTTWGNVWGYGECYRKEPIVFKDGKYLVVFVSCKIPGVIVELDLFERGRVFIEGELADVKMLRGHVGQEITFHVAHRHVENIIEGDLRKKFFVACAWIGSKPSPELVLKDKLAVPKGLVSSPWRYDAVVNSFPLPSYALCYIGFVPVLVLVVEQEVLKFPDLKVGDRLIVSAYDTPVGDSFAVLSNDVTNLSKVSDMNVIEVYRNLTGRVVSVPNPVGKIKVTGANIEVSFEFCHLRRVKEKSRVTNKKWLAQLMAAMKVGKQVYLSAFKSKSKSVPYRAFEVYIDN